MALVEDGEAAVEKKARIRPNKAVLSSTESFRSLSRENTLGDHAIVLKPFFVTFRSSAPSTSFSSSSSFSSFSGRARKDILDLTANAPAVGTLRYAARYGGGTMCADSLDDDGDEDWLEEECG